MTAALFDPFVAGFAEDPYPHYARLRETAPAHRHDLGFWIVTDHRTVSELQRSGHSVDEQYLVHKPVWKDDPRAPGRQNRPMHGLSMLDQDPPDHTRLRRLVHSAFTRASVDAWEPRITELVDAALDRIAAAGRADVVAELAFPLPFTVISEMLGVPVADHDRVRALTGSLVRALEPLTGPDLQGEIRDANLELTGMLRELAVWKRAHPADDLFSALIAAEHDGEVLDEDELVAQVMLLYVAGHETTVNLIGNGILALLRRPDQARLLREDPTLAAGAVEEILRFDTPVQLMRRITTGPVAVHDVEIPAGSFVLAGLAAANRDPQFWGPDADELRLTRPDAHRHVSFGAGLHHCLGASLVRLEARVALSRFVCAFPDAVLEDVTWNGRINVRGPAAMTVAVR